MRLWKVELQNLANETGLAITVTHHPPGTSKWNRIEHRMFSFISINWRGRPLLSHQVIVQLIASTKTETGLTIACDIDWGRYPKGIKIPKAAPVARFPGRGRRLPAQPALYARPRPGLACQTQPSRELSQAAKHCCCTVEARLGFAGLV